MLYVIVAQFLVECFQLSFHELARYTRCKAARHLDHVVVYLGDKLFQVGQEYVALSRVRYLEGLQISELDSAKLTGNRSLQ